MPVVTLLKPETCSLPNLSTTVVSRPRKIRINTVKADYDTLKSMIAPLQFNCVREYNEYIKENNLTDIFPLNPANYYKKQWTGAKDFLSMSQDRVDARNKARSLKAVAVRNQNMELNKNVVKTAKTKVTKTESISANEITVKEETPNAVQTIFQLIDLGVPVNLVESVFKSMNLSIAELKECVIYLLNK